MKNKIYDIWLANSIFCENIEKYNRYLSKQKFPSFKNEYTELVKTLLPLKTFLVHKNEIKKIKCFSKNSPEDYDKIDAKIKCNDIEKNIQLCLASSEEEEQQHSYQDKLLYCKSESTPVSATGKIYNPKESNRLSDQQKEQCKTFSISDEKSTKIWHQENNGRCETVSEHYKKIECALKKKRNNLPNNPCILLIGFRDGLLFSDDKIQEIKNLLTETYSHEQYQEIYLVGISKQSEKCYFQKLKGL